MTAGLRKITEQHHELREAILHLQKDLRHPPGDRPPVNAIDHLLHQMNAHFRFEEAYLEHTGYPDLAKQRAEHEQCLAHIIGLKERAGAGDATVPLELSTYLFDWLRLHTLQEEAAFLKHRPGT
jgi:hemerythrin-like metal-binding protein